MSTTAGRERGLRDRPLGKLALLLGVLLVAFVVARGCGSGELNVDEQEAISIARRAIDYRPERVQVRLVRRGVRSRAFWAVSLSTRTAGGSFENVTVVVVDARTGRIDEVHRERSGRRGRTRERPRDM